jgi:hypothetical protein
MKINFIEYFCDKSIKGTVRYVKCNTFTVMTGKLEWKDHLKNLGIDRKIVIRWSLRK